MKVMSPGDVVDFTRHGLHRAVVLAVDSRGCVVIQCTSHEREMDGVAVAPRSTEYRSLGWSPHDDRSSYFYRSGIFVARVEELTPRLAGHVVLRCHPLLFLKLREKVNAWILARSLAPDAAALLAPRSTGTT